MLDVFEVNITHFQLSHTLNICENLDVVVTVDNKLLVWHTNFLGLAACVLLF